MSIEEYLSFKQKADDYDRMKEKHDMAKAQNTEWMQAYAMIEDYAIEKHGLDLHDFANHLERCKKSGLFRGYIKA